VVRLVPPLIISRAEADQLVNELTPLIRAFLMKPAPAAAPVK
jgi:4-aminobutyrate aminotransferase-like enzyme